MMNLTRLLAYEERLQAGHATNMAQVRAMKISIAVKRKFFCKHCEKESRLGTWGFVQVYHYTSPSGRNEGDYWTPEETEVCHLVCPKCVKETYIYNAPFKEKLLDLLLKVNVPMTEIFAYVWERRGTTITQIHPVETQMPL